MGWLNHQLVKVYCSSKFADQKKFIILGGRDCMHPGRFPHTQVMEQWWEMQHTPVQKPAKIFAEKRKNKQKR